jgi:molybdate transport system substrate-binding protein
MLKVLSTHAVQGAMVELVARFEAGADTPVAVDYGPTNGVLARISAGDAADVAILTRAGIEELARHGILDGATAVDLARSLVGIAVRAGARKPDIGTAEALKEALLAAKSIAYSRLGASGVLFAELIQRLGIAGAVNAKATVIPSGLTGELVARGEAQLAVQQLSELMLVPGLDLVGPLPASLQTPGMFSAAMFAAATRPDAALQFLQGLASPEAAAVFRAAGLEPVR